MQSITLAIAIYAVSYVAPMILVPTVALKVYQSETSLYMVGLLGTALGLGQAVAPGIAGALIQASGVLGLFLLIAGGGSLLAMLGWLGFIKSQVSTSSTMRF